MVVKFEDKPQFKKGEYAEEIVDDHLKSKGFVIYKPQGGCAHAFDSLVIKNKQNVIIAECKAKARRNHYPDTGMNTKNLNEYLFIQNKYNITVFVYFADEMLKEIYGNRLAVLTQSHEIEWKGTKLSYPKVEGKITYFSYDKMIKIADLTDTQVQNLKKLSTRKHNYKY